MATQFPSPVEPNFFGYRIVDNVKHAQANNVTASFKYHGYEIGFSTFNPAGAKVVVLRNKILVDEYGSVEAACAAVDEMRAWRGASVAMDRDVQQPRYGRNRR